MKQLLKRCLSRAVRNDRIWSILKATIVQTGQYLEWERRKSQPDLLELERRAVLQKHLADLVVKHGPFKGLRFPHAEAVTGSLLPKLLGTYELELHAVVESMCAAQYEQIINIGAGEGYYAVGLALRCPQAKILAYDTSAEARTQCAAMARLNNVSDRLHIGAEFTRAMLMDLSTSQRTLIVCDCEGYEKQLFDSESVVAALKQHDVLIEIHDFVDIEISTQLRQAFAQTHALKVIPAIGNIQRALLCDYPELSEYAKQQCTQLISEDRNFEMEWFWLTSNSSRP